MKLPQWFSADGQTYLGAMPASIAPEGAIQSPEEIFDARGVSLDVDTMQVVYPDPETLLPTVERVRLLFDVLDDADRSNLLPYIKDGLLALDTGSERGLNDALTDASAAAVGVNGSQAQVDFLTAVQSILSQA